MKIEVLEDNWEKKHKHVENKQHATKKTNGSTKKSKRKLKNTLRLWNYTHKFPKSMRHSKSSSKREIYTIQAYLNKQENSQIYNQTFHLKELEKEQQSPKLVEERK